MAKPTGNPRELVETIINEYKDDPETLKLLVQLKRELGNNLELTSSELIYKTVSKQGSVRIPRDVRERLIIPAGTTIIFKIVGITNRPLPQPNLRAEDLLKGYDDSLLAPNLLPSTDSLSETGVMS